jgi:hypothetical protein
MVEHVPSMPEIRKTEEKKEEEAKEAELRLTT